MSVPNGWTIRSLGDLGRWSGGGTPSKAITEYWENGTIPWVSPKDMRSDRISITEDYITPSAVDNSSTKLYPAGSVLVVTRSGILRRKVPVALALVPVAVNQDIKVLPSSKAISTEYVANFMWCYNETILARCAKDGTTVESIDTTSLLGFPIKLPPLPEQKKIAQILSTWDEAITTSERLLDLARQQKKALMQQLLTGKKRLLDKNGVKFSGEWRTGKLNSLVGRIFGGGTPSRANPELWGGKIPWVTVKDLISTRIDGAQEFINERGLLESSSNLVPAGTVILSTRMAVGKTVIASCDVAINQDLKAISSSEKVCSEYLFYWFLYHSRRFSR